jgi:3-hydroxypropanoate dehydrogenase
MSATAPSATAGTPSRRALGKVLHVAPAHPKWSDAPIPRDVLEQLHALMSLGPAMVDASPTRVLFLNSGVAKARLAPLLPDRTRDEILAAPVCAVVGYDVDFAEQLVEFLPRSTAIRSCFDDPDVVRQVAARNGTVQGAYLIVAARSLGLEAAAFPDFDEAGVSFEFFRAPRVRANFLCSLGYPAEPQARHATGLPELEP